MTASELIGQLRAFPADSRVVLPHFYRGFQDLAAVHAEPVRRAAEADRSMAHGTYEGADPMDEGPFVADETAIVLDVEARLSAVG